MPYRLITGESVEDGVRRILSEQIKQSLSQLADTNLDRAETIHQVRKRCKKIRAALRLVRGSLGKAYAKENAWYRDAARQISALRDIQAMIETCDTLAQHSADSVDRETIRPIRLALETRKNALMADTDRIDTLLQDFESAMVEGQKRVASLNFDGDGNEAAIAGMRRTYARGRAAMNAAYANPTPETFHEWRKRVKYHLHHMSLLREAWPDVVRARRDETDKLGELLGDHHDLCVLRSWVLDNPAPSAKEKEPTNFIALVDHRVAEIERESQPLGQRLFAEKPGHLARRFSIYLRIWSKEGDQ